MLLSEMTQKQLLKTAYIRHKPVAICGFVEFPRPILTIDGSISLLLQTNPQMRLYILKTLPESAQTFTRDSFSKRKHTLKLESNLSKAAKTQNFLHFTSLN